MAKKESKALEIFDIINSWFPLIIVVVIAIITTEIIKKNKADFNRHQETTLPTGKDEFNVDRKSTALDPANFINK